MGCSCKWGVVQAVSAFDTSTFALDEAAAFSLQGSISAPGPEHAKWDGILDLRM